MTGQHFWELRECISVGEGLWRFRLVCEDCGANWRSEILNGAGLFHEAASVGFPPKPYPACCNCPGWLKERKVGHAADCPATGKNQ